MELFLLQLFVFLAAAAIAVPLAKKLGLGSVLGYLIAGMAIGPFGLALIHEVEDVMHFTEFGVVMMLFLVGLELRPSMLWRMRVKVLGLGGSQVTVTTLAVAGIAFFFLPWQQALAIGMVLSLSSTAIVLQTLQESGAMESGAGRSIFSVLLFQDLAVIPMLAGLPLLATLPLPEADSHGATLFDISALPDHYRAGLTVSAILLVLVVGRFLCDPIFRAIARSGVREVFIAAALGLVIGTAVLMIAVGLSPALGAFLAGMMLAGSEFRHELESDIEPFKGLLLGIYFISIGASLDFALIGENLGAIAAITVGLLAVKAAVLFLVGGLFGVRRRDLSLLSVGLAQGGEFAFVLFQFARTHGVLPADVLELLVSAVAISMFLTPLIFIAHDKLTRSGDVPAGPEKSEPIDAGARKVILAGFGRLGTDVGRYLIAAGVRPVFLDLDAGNVEVLRKLGFEVYYGDATRQDLLESAGIQDAQLLVVSIGDPETALKIAEMTRKHYPTLHVVMSAKDRRAAFQLMERGFLDVHRETFGSALMIGEAALRRLGVDPYEAYRLKRIFRKKDHDMTPALFERRSEEAAYITLYRQQHADLEQLMRLDEEEKLAELDEAWTAENPEG